MTLTNWDAQAGTWDAQADKWDIINFSLSGTLQVECRLSSPVSFVKAIPGVLQTEIILNSPPEFPLVNFMGNIQLTVELASKVDYALWVEEAPRNKVWVEETPG